MKMKVSIENCYGIGKLDYEFDFANTNIYLIYAQNGVFKTSFAKTLKTLIDGKEQPKDEIFTNRKSKAEVFCIKRMEKIKRLAKKMLLSLIPMMRALAQRRV